MQVAGSVHFKFGFDFFQTFCVSGFFIIFFFFFKVNSWIFLHNRVATLNRTERRTAQKGRLHLRTDQRTARYGLQKRPAGCELWWKFFSIETRFLETVEALNSYLALTIGK